ncbi:MAG: hypothetical protein CME96_08605 [Hyphomonas sp.]|nr:hypothetical protein [Hyphomonas sp.]
MAERRLNDNVVLLNHELDTQERARGDVGVGVLVVVPVGLCVCLKQLHVVCQRLANARAQLHGHERADGVKQVLQRLKP